MKRVMRLNRLPVFISSLMLLCSCTEDTDFVPFKYQFERFEFVDTTKAMNYKGEYVSSSRVLDKEDFLFNKDLGFEPAEEIQILSESTAKFIYTSERYGYLELAANYSRDHAEINFRIEPLNATSDSLYLTFINEYNGLIVTAYGVKKFIWDGHGLAIDQYKTYILYPSVLFSNMTSTDTLYLQEFISVYESKGSGL